MLKFGNNNIFTGYIKQLLHSFNLPKSRVYTKKQKQYFKANGTELNVLTTVKKFPGASNISTGFSYPTDMRYYSYIKDGYFQHYIEEIKGENNDIITHRWESTSEHYHPNRKVLNLTKNLVISNNLYDYYTHEYLGDFLRFIRDYYDLNLMPLYNCFSNRICNNIYFNINKTYTITTTVNGIPTELNSSIKATFDSTDSNYKIYMLPVKLFNSYTIAIDCEYPIELFCGFYGAYMDTRNFNTELAKATFRRISGSKFNKPFIYDGLSSESIKKFSAEGLDPMNLAQEEEDLKLFIKLPSNLASSITILEGDYTNYNNTFLEGNKVLQNHTVTNYFTGDIYNNIYVDSNDRQVVKNANEAWTYVDDNTAVPSANISGITEKTVLTMSYPKLEDREFEPITTLQLLQLNTGESYPFSDKLIEYLIDNVITHLDTIPDNIKRVQAVLTRPYKPGSNPYDPGVDNTAYQPEHEGIWDKKIRHIIYDYMNNTNNNKINSELRREAFGYVDKAAEQLVQNKDNISIAKIDIYSNLYKSNKN